MIPPTLLFFSILFDFTYPGGSDSKVSVCNAGDLGSIPGLGRFPRRRKWQPTPVFLPGKSHGQRSLVGYHPWGGKQSDMTERLNFMAEREEELKSLLMKVKEES